MIEIKPIAAEHLPALAGLYEELMEEPARLDRLTAAFDAIERDPRYILLGAFAAGELAGSIMGIVCQDLVGECRPFMVIENVIVSSRHQRMGIGKTLMSFIETAARERGCSYIILVSGARRKAAHQMYAALGYRDEPVEGYRKYL